MTNTDRPMDVPARIRQGSGHMDVQLSFPATSLIVVELTNPGFCKEMGATLAQTMTLHLHGEIEYIFDHHNNDLPALVRAIGYDHLENQVMPRPKSFEAVASTAEDDDRKGPEITGAGNAAWHQDDQDDPPPAPDGKPRTDAEGNPI